MKAWIALLGSPLLVLAEQSTALALVSTACARQAGAWLHAVPALFLLPTLVIALAASRGRAGAPAQGAVLGRIPELMAWFCVVVLLALWLPVWGVDPCRA